MARDLLKRCNEAEALAADCNQALISIGEAITAAEIAAGIKLDGYEYGSFEQRIARLAAIIAKADTPKGGD